LTGAPIASRTVVLDGPEFVGATNYRDVVSIGLARGTIEISGRGIAGMMLTPLRIPRADVRFCGKTCFGPSNWDADVMRERPAVKIRFRNAQEVIDWCWEERVPIRRQAVVPRFLAVGARVTVWPSCGAPPPFSGSRPPGNTTAKRHRGGCMRSVGRSAGRRGQCCRDT
jgi:hypothetical protein